MHKLFFLPLSAALALSCSSPTSLQTSEYDDVYYSKKDKTIFRDEAALAAAPAEQEAGTESGAAIANPEYSPKNSGGSRADNNTDYNSPDYYSQDYYDEDDYYYASRIRRFNAPYRGFSYFDFAYTDYYWYNRNPLYYGHSAYYDPFYGWRDPFYYPCYTCYGYPPYYAGVTIMIGRPYSRWGGWNPYYGGLGGGWYGGGYGRNYSGNGWYRNDNSFSRPVQYGPRRDRSEVPTGNAGNAPVRQRREIGDNAVPGGGGGIVQPAEGGLRTTRSTRGRSADPNSGNISQPETPGMNRPEDSRTGTRSRTDRSGITVPADRSLDPADTDRPSRRRLEPRENVPVMPREERIGQPERSSEEMPSRRSRSREYQRDMSDQPVYQPRQEPRSTPSYPRSEPSRQRSQDIFRSEPTYQAPQRQERIYSPPSSPSYDAPSRSSGGGGGSDGGGGGRSTRGRGN